MRLSQHQESQDMSELAVKFYQNDRSLTHVLAVGQKSIKRTQYILHAKIGLQHY
jgi:hypothetical protein